MSPDILVLKMYIYARVHRLSVSESEEWVCTKTVFPNASTLRACEKTYTGIHNSITKATLFFMFSANTFDACESVNEYISGGERFSSCFYSSSPLTPLRCLCSSEFCNSAPQSLFSTLVFFTISIFTILYILELSPASSFHITLSRCVVCL